MGVARTKFLAKVASAVAKPDGLLVVPADRELEFLHPLPVERLWGVGDVTARKLHDAGLHTVRDVAEVSVRALTELLGRGSARHLHALGAHAATPDVSSGESGAGRSAPSTPLAGGRGRPRPWTPRWSRSSTA